MIAGRDVVRVVLRHLTGSRATQVDLVPLGPHRELILGRAPTAAVRFDLRKDAAVGRYHARIELAAGPIPGFVLVDLCSRNGTYLNGRRLDQPAPLRHGDLVRLGERGPEMEVRFEALARL